VVEVVGDADSKLAAAVAVADDDSTRRTHTSTLGKGRRSIAVRKKPHRYGNSRAIWDHTVLPATRQR